MPDDIVNAEIKLNIGGGELDIKMQLPVKPVKLRRMLPVFQHISNVFIESGIQSLKAKGEEVSCKIGCTACCYYLVPLSEVEAHNIKAAVEEMEEPQRSEIRRRFEHANNHFEENGWFKKAAKAFKTSEKESVKVINEYFQENIACPFLENDMCSIHSNRPTACREHLVLSPPENCWNPNGDGVNRVGHMLRVSNALNKISRTMPENEMPVVPLIKALEWTEKHKEMPDEKTGEQWVNLFFQNLSPEK